MVYKKHGDTLGEHNVKNTPRTNTSIESEFGWLFLANDTNDFFAQQFGRNLWSDEDAAHANQFIGEIEAKLKG